MHCADYSYFSANSLTASVETDSFFKIVEKDVETKMSGGRSRLFAHPATGMFVFAFLLRFCRQAQESHQTLCVFVPGFN
jgi:hypothetical protein